jgi:nitroreductase
MPRQSIHPIHPLILNRWSPRALSGESMTHEELMPLFEAARWAPSSYNAQPWRFVYARRGTPEWETFMGLLIDFNKAWACNAAVLVVVVARTTFEHNGKPSVTHAFDAGAAWENLALEASARGLVAHGMQGFDYAAAAQAVKMPGDHVILAMIAIGKPGRKEDLSAELQEREEPSDRRALEEIVMEGEMR